MPTLHQVEPSATAAFVNATTHAADLRCVICNAPFDFDAGEFPVVLRHVAYGYDLTHPGACLESASQWIFAEPGFDSAAFAPDLERQRIVAVSDPEGWAAVFPSAPELIARGRTVQFEMLWRWALVEHRDGSRRREGLVRDPAWVEEPGAIEFPEARVGRRSLLGYASPAQLADPQHTAAWESALAERLGIGAPLSRAAAAEHRPVSSTAPHSLRRFWARFGTHRR